MDTTFKTAGFLLFFLLSSLWCLNGCLGRSMQKLSSGNNPFTAKAYLVRYWNTHISNDLPKPSFLLSKASPLTAVDSAVLAKLAAQGSLHSHIQSFCSLANLFCIFDESEVTSPKPVKDADFASYGNKGFGNYGTSRSGGLDSFRNYSDGLNTPNNWFKRYSRASNGRLESFTNYAMDGNVANGSFASYGFGATSGSGVFNNYDQRVNVPNLKFTTYDSGGAGHKLSFATYSSETNSGEQSFNSYGKRAKNRDNAQDFTTYGQSANTLRTGFSSYGELSSGANDSFTSYGVSGNNPRSSFKGYGTGGKAPLETFANYRNGANVGEDSFLTYARSANSAKASFSDYGRTFNVGNDTFTDYGKGSQGKTTVDFTSYTLGRSFQEYAQKGISVAFNRYNNVSTTTKPFTGRFFRERMLRQGTVLPMPDIRDKMPTRSFLPRSILSKLPFSTSRLADLKRLFHAPDNSTMERLIADSLSECERLPSPGETKACVGSAEDMIDFAVSILGRDITVRTTENVNGSNGKVMIGAVRGINGGRVTKSVSCHQSWYPYLLYYCHSVPKVRVYEADILHVKSKDKINYGVAVCHLDTSAWSPNHGAFLALGSGPGRIEVCHWIFQNDMTWTLVH